MDQQLICAVVFTPWQSDNRVKKAVAEGQLDLFLLGAQPEDIQGPEAQTEEEVRKVNRQEDQQAEKLKKAAASRKRMVLLQELPREAQIIDPEGVSEQDYKIIGQEVTEVLVMVPASFKVKRIIRRKWALKDPLNTDQKGVMIAPIPARTIQRGLFDESVLKEWMVRQHPRVLPSSPIGKAIVNALPLMDNMKFYTLHGDLQLDNNLIENAIRLVALGRKNSAAADRLFAGTHDTAQNAAMIYSLFATCKKHQVNPQEWLIDTLLWPCSLHFLSLKYKFNR